MTPPIIVNDHGDVSIFCSREKAERYLESPDILDNRYVAYDSEGRLLKLHALPLRSKRFLGIKVVAVEKVTISDDDLQPFHAEELKAVLRDLLEALGTPAVQLREATLENLLTRSIDRLGFTR